MITIIVCNSFPSPSMLRGFSEIFPILDVFPVQQDSLLAQAIANIQTTRSCFLEEVKKAPRDLEDELLEETEWRAEQRQFLAQEARRLARVHRPIWKGFPIRRRNRNLHIQ